VEQFVTAMLEFHTKEEEEPIDEVEKVAISTPQKVFASKQKEVTVEKVVKPVRSTSLEKIENFNIGN
jgi:hypothetical protein